MGINFKNEIMRNSQGLIESEGEDKWGRNPEERKSAAAHAQRDHAPTIKKKDQQKLKGGRGEPVLALEE